MVVFSCLFNYFFQPCQLRLVTVCYQQVVNYLLRGWIKNLETQGSVSLPLLDDRENALCNIDRDLEFVRDGSRKSVRVRFFGSKFSLWNRIISFIRFPFGKS